MKRKLSTRDFFVGCEHKLHLHDSKKTTLNKFKENIFKLNVPHQAWISEDIAFEFALRNCIHFWVWSSPDRVLNVLLQIGLIYLKNCETLIPLSINLNSSTCLVSLIWFHSLINTTQ